jgi:hypothetical protein
VLSVVTRENEQLLVKLPANVKTECKNRLRTTRCLLFYKSFATQKVFNKPPHPPAPFSGGGPFVAGHLAVHGGGGSLHTAARMAAWRNDSRQ